MRAYWPKQPFGFSMRNQRDAPCSPTGLMSPGLDELPHRNQKQGCGFVDNSLAKTASEPGHLPWKSRKPRDFPTAHPFAHKLHSPNNIFIFFSK